MKRIWIVTTIVMTLVIIALSIFLYMAMNGDINLDGKVDLLDLSILSNKWTK